MGGSLCASFFAQASTDCYLACCSCDSPCVGSARVYQHVVGYVYFEFFELSSMSGYLIGFDCSPQVIHNVAHDEYCLGFCSTCILSHASMFCYIFRFNTHDFTLQSAGLSKPV